jgi:dolichyl-phosphate-mannose-protein mannosyltransferase
VTATAPAVEHDATADGAPDRRRPLSAFAVPAALVVLTGALRLWDLDFAERLYFDEKYYARDALDYVERGVEENRPAHPPLGKWLIAAGIELLGNRPLGWRVPAVLAGTLTVLVTYLLGLRLTGSRTVAALAGLLVAVDGLAFTSSRIAMLDVFLGLWVVVAGWLVVRDLAARRDGPRGVPQALLGSRWRWLAGVALGLAVSTKWTGLLAVGAAGLVVMGAEAAAGAGWRGRLARTAAAATGAAAAFLLVPAVVYLASYAGWFAHYEQSYAGARACGQASTCDPNLTERLATWGHMQADLVAYHERLDATHPYRSSPAGWPLLERPVLYYLETCAPDRTKEQGPCRVEPGQKAKVLGVGNPALWWLAVLTAPVLLWRAVRRRDRAAAVVLVFLASLWLPWFAAGKPGYLFYLVPAVPFLALGVAVAVARGRRQRQIAAAVGGLAIAVFAWLYPVLAGVALAEERSSWRMLLDSWV